MSPLEIYVWFGPVVIAAAAIGGAVLFARWSERNLERELREEAQRKARPAE